MENKEQIGYIRYGTEWEKEMMKLPKKAIIGMFRKIKTQSAQPIQEQEQLETDFKELHLYLDALCTQTEKDAGHLWIAFSDKFRAFKKKVLKSKQPAQPILQEQTLQKAALEYAIHHSSAPDKETPDWIISDFKAGAEWQKNNPEPILQDDVIEAKHFAEKFIHWNDDIREENRYPNINDIHKFFEDNISPLLSANARLQKENEELKNNLLNFTKKR